MDKRVNERTKDTVNASGAKQRWKARRINQRMSNEGEGVKSKLANVSNQ